MFDINGYFRIMAQRSFFNYRFILSGTGEDYRIRGLYNKSNNFAA